MKYTVIAPHVSEKSLADAQLGIYTFDVLNKSTKTEIARQIEEIYGVHVTKVTTTSIAGKVRIVGKKRTKVARPDRKKARVQLKKGEKIKIFDVGAKK